MNRKVAERIYRACLLVVVLLLTGIAAGCAHRLHASMQPDGWSAQPVVSACRFAPMPTWIRPPERPWDEGYYLYILTEAADWDFSDETWFLFSILQRPSAHSWIILESPGIVWKSATPATSGRRHRVTMRRDAEGSEWDPNPIAYVWQTMSDGQFQIGKPDRPPRSSGECRSPDDGIN